LAAALRAGVERFVLTSSIAALGVPAPRRTLTEADHFNLPPRRFPYGHSKHLAECELQTRGRRGASGRGGQFRRSSSGRATSTAPESAMFVEAAQGRLRVAAPGGTNFVAVGDVVQGHIAAAERGRVGERYILAGENLSFRDAFTTVCDIAGRPGPAVVLPRWTIPVAAAAVGAAAS